MEHLKIKDSSGDKMYFTIIPNYILNHSTAVDQALYLQLKRLAGEKSLCYPSKKWLMKQMGVGIKALNKSLLYLTSHNWIEKAGTKTIKTIGGPQQVTQYHVLDLWQVNNNYYAKGGAKRTPLNAKGGAESNQRGVLLRPKEEPMKKIERLTPEQQKKVEEIRKSLASKFRVPA